ncbi:DEAD/DEAH box helicase domain protein [Beutenbergia cavernae DSM 12333]|uniref:RNA helicase n=1 Tax=Beutenbergia cavernae (strain ATCC BAA-8 / DSM 12333 / CCUG 43141 / JCM 11478 / NBRC 16432 / NCIMB 13614 / HKI 0122) TaxID=471853 RepID=C5BZ36_BEUC1|nr:DEAD/DEAH box helicase [Beutenbergia cavernae]ACQ81151.1 DEAD/DEAH box helicase domain protein [Beutenbergia cavernae DSM 12333]
MTDTTTAPVPSPTDDAGDVDAASLDAVVEETIEAAEVDAAPHATDERTFADFGVSDAIVTALRDVGIVHPFPIQSLTLPVALQAHDIIGQAKTGTGKTLGFGIPLLERVVGPGEDGWDAVEAPGAPQALVVVPTRELAVQVAGDLETAARHRKARVVQLYGGRAYEPQVAALGRGTEVVVGTPGRMIDLMRQRVLDLSHVRTVVLDEADEMLDLGFLPDVETLLAATPPQRHTMLFSATMPGAVVALARRFMSHPTHIRAHDPNDDGATLKAIRKVVYRAHALDKVEMLARLLQADGRGLTIVFTRTKRTAAKVADELVDRGFAAAAIHGDLGQGAREQALRAFRHGKVDVLVATDVAARGIDIDDVTHVVNYQCPEDEKTFLHRIGRTGRAGNTGTAVTFVDWDDIPRWALIDRALELGTPNPPETYSTSPHFYSDLGIPEGTKGRLPRGARTRAGLEAEELEDIGETGKHHGTPTARGGRDGERRGRDGERRGRDGDRHDRPAGGDGPRGEGGRRRRPRRTASEAPADGQARRSDERPAGEQPRPDGEQPRRRRRRRRGGAGDGTAPAAPADGGSPTP